MSATETWRDYLDRAKADLQMVGLRLREKNTVLAESWLLPARRSLDAAYVAGIHMEADHNAAQQRDVAVEALTDIVHTDKSQCYSIGNKALARIAELGKLIGPAEESEETE